MAIWLLLDARGVAEHGLSPLLHAQLGLDLACQQVGNYLMARDHRLFSGQPDLGVFLAFLEHGAECCQFPPEFRGFHGAPRMTRAARQLAEVVSALLALGIEYTRLFIASTIMLIIRGCECMGGPKSWQCWKGGGSVS